jgi:hypothetical protein
MTYRFKFTQEFDSALAEFSTTFKYNNDRKQFKDAFHHWTIQNEEKVSKETARLRELKYEGNILNKMFVSARYYYRKRSSTRNDPKKRRCYKAVGSSLIQAIDHHIMSQMKKEDRDKYKPSEAFLNFYLENASIVEEELARQGIVEPTDKETRIKKAFKNRCYLHLNLKGIWKKS